jgi:hypothetical protein
VNDEKLKDGECNTNRSDNGNCLFAKRLERGCDETTEEIFDSDEEENNFDEYENKELIEVAFKISSEDGDDEEIKDDNKDEVIKG